MHTLLRLQRALRYTRITRSPYELYHLSKYREIYADHLGRDEAGRLVIPKTKVELVRVHREFLLQGLSLVNDLRQRCEAKFDLNEVQEVILEIGGIRLMLSCWEELFITHEIFYRGIYNIGMSRPFRVIDVGMNTGTTSLFFASNPLCERIDAFELFGPTAQRAIKNFDLNPSIKDKIVPNPYGLGAKEEELVLDYFPEYKGSVGKGGLPAYARPNNVTVAAQSVPVKVCAAGSVFQGLIDQANGTPVVCKLDCEGSEYEILRALAQAGLLGRVSCFMIEWHQQGPQEIKMLLSGSGFEFFSFDEHSGTHGMIYAFRERD